MKKGLTMVTVLLGTGFLAATLHAQTDEPAGKKLFLDNKCNMCHSIQSVSVEKKMASSKAPDLSAVGDTRTAEWITQWLKKEVDLKGKKHLATLKASDEDIKTLVDWLVTLKTVK